MVPRLTLTEKVIVSQWEGELKDPIGFWRRQSFKAKVFPRGTSGGFHGPSAEAARTPSEHVVQVLRVMVLHAPENLREGSSLAQRTSRRTEWAQAGPRRLGWSRGRGLAPL